jgi:hypothetical protein
MIYQIGPNNGDNRVMGLRKWDGMICEIGLNDEESMHNIVIQELNDGRMANRI